MLSKKMAFSLMSLITILALAFVAPSAMAATFGVALAEHADQPDIGAAPGLQVERADPLKVKVMFGEFVELATTNVSVGGFDMEGIYIPAVVVAKIDPADKAANEFTLEITTTAATSRVTVMIAKDIASANAFSKNMSKELTADVYLYSPDVDISPDVYGIRRADGSALPLTGGAVNVVITLSEEPESFTAAHIDVTNATAGTPAKLNTIRQNAVGLTQFATHIDKPLLKAYTPMQIRDGILKTAVPAKDGSARDEYDFKGINYYLSLVAQGGDPLALDKAGGTSQTTDDIPGDYIAAVNKLKSEIGTADDLVPYYYENNDGVVQVNSRIQHEDADNPPGFNVSDGEDDQRETDAKFIGMPLKDGDKLTGSVRPPTKKGTADLVEEADTPLPAVTILAVSFDRSEKKKDYARPDAVDFAAVDDYNFARARYNALTGSTADGQRTAYEKEKKIYDAYIALQKLIQEARMEAITDREEELIAAARAGTTTEIAGNVLPPTGRDGMLHPYAVTLTPTYATASDIVVKVNRWQNMASDPGVYKPPVLETGYTEGFDKLTIPVSASVVKTMVTTMGVVEITLPFAITIPAASPGYLIFAANAAGSGISIPGGVTDANGLTTAVATARRPVQRLYNIVDLSKASAAHATVEPLPNLENFLRDGGTIHLSGPAGLVISEIMWGTDASLSPHNHSQWVEIKNVTGAPLVAAAGTLGLTFIAPNETLPAGTIAIDSVGTVTSTSSLWNIYTKGQGGRTGTGEQAQGVTPVASPQGLVSMQRVFSDIAQTMPLDGRLSTSWAASAEALNFDREAVGRRIGSPGAQPLNPPAPPAPPPPPPPPPATPIAGDIDIVITEIMVDTSSDRLPQWIELTHVGTGEVSLSGWTMVIDNAIDADVLGGGNAITVKLDGVILDVSTDTRNAGKGQSLLVVAWASGRKSNKIHADRVLDIAPQLGQKGRYQLLSYDGFRVTLVPPQKGAIATFGDIVGNLDEEWDIMMLEGAKRSSLIRREMSTAGAALNGTEAAGWILASATPLIAGPETYYGDDEDAGTPGYDAGGPLPVELSHFRPARDKQTGQVVITWATQSELNNAGFFIKRSNQRNGQFKVINATMIAGAGTMSEKQFYTYTDTTAQPNVVYYYQIEDVSLDGNRQLLTRGIRLKGHIGAAGKATVIWGDLKASHE